MSDSNSVWASPIDLPDRLGFIDRVTGKWGDRAQMKEQSLHWDVLGSEINTALGVAGSIVNPIAIASAAADSSSILRMTQNPNLLGGKQAGDTLIFVCGVYVRVSLDRQAIALIEAANPGATLDITAAAQEALFADASAFEDGMHVLSNGSVLRFELDGDEVTSYSVSRMVQAVYAPVAAVTRPFFGGALTTKDRGWCKLVPFELGVNQQTTWAATLPLRTYAATTRVRFCLRALTASVT